METTPVGAGGDLAGPESVRTDLRGRRAVRAAFSGWIVDYYDISLPTVALAPAFGYFVAPDLSRTTQTTIFFVTFAVSLLARPIGSVIFGSVSDRLGRRRGTLLSLIGFSTATLLMALLPGYAATGYLGLALLLALRFVGGVFMGGEYSAANPLALESTPKGRRGTVGGVISSAYPIGNVLISVFTAALLAWVPADGAYTQWGWRIPFLIGAGLGVVFLLYRRRLEESPRWVEAVERHAAAGRSTRPVRELFSGANWRNLRQVFLMMTGLWFAALMLTGAAPGLFTQYFTLPSDTVTYGILAANVIAVGAYVGAGVVGQRVGRRRALTATAVGIATVGSAGFALMVLNLRAGGPFVVTIALYAVLLCLTLAPFGIVTTYLIERFTIQVRSSGYGIGYTFAIVVPSFYSFVMVGLGTVMPYDLTPVVFIAVGGVIAAIGAHRGPETRHVDL